MRTEFERAAAANRDKAGKLARHFQNHTDVVNGEKVVRVVVVSEDAIAAAQASLVLERIEGNFEAEARIVHSWWNYEDLDITALKIVAAFDAVAADIIVFAVHDGSQLPEKAINWISNWLAMGNLRARALLAVLDSETKRSRDSGSTLSQLSKVAELGQMDFLATSERPRPGRREKRAAENINNTNRMDYEISRGAKTCCQPV